MIKVHWGFNRQNNLKFKTIHNFMKTKYFQRFFMLLFIGFTFSLLQACGDDEMSDLIQNPNEEETMKPDDGNEGGVKPDNGGEENELIYKYDYYAVDLGLSVRWATCNVGTYRAEQPGDYFAWGETTEKSTYTQQNSVTLGKNFSDISGNVEYDAARANWGGMWRMPTYAECQELKDRCTWIKTTIDGNNGFEVIGPNGNSIFLPTTGHAYDKMITLTTVMGFYWTSTPCDSNGDAYSLQFTTSDDYTAWEDGERDTGCCIRPVVNY